MWRRAGFEQSVLFAKEIGAKITAVTVTEPFNVFSLAPSQLEYTPIEYKKHVEAYAGKVLGTVSAAAKSAGVVCETLLSGCERQLILERQREGIAKAKAEGKYKGRKPTALAQANWGQRAN